MEKASVTSSVEEEEEPEAEEEVEDTPPWRKVTTRLRTARSSPSSCRAVGGVRVSVGGGRGRGWAGGGGWV